MINRFPAFSFVLVFLLSSSIFESFEKIQDPIDGELLEAFNLINRARGEGCMCGNEYYPPVEPLVWTEVLYQFADRHARLMNEKKELKFSNYYRVGIRNGAREIGDDYDILWESIGLVEGGPNEAIKAWLDHPRECKNIMNPLLEEIGIARSESYWCQQLGLREE